MPNNDPAGHSQSQCSPLRGFGSDLGGWLLRGGRELSAIRSCCAVISFFVNVPVLSVHIMLVEPNVSTDDSCLTTTFFLASLFDARDNAMEICAGMPCGTSDIPTPSANKKASYVGSFTIIAIKNSIDQTITVPMVSLIDMLFISFCSGEKSDFVCWLKFAI